MGRSLDIVSGQWIFSSLPSRREVQNGAGKQGRNMLNEDRWLLISDSQAGRADGTKDTSREAIATPLKYNASPLHFAPAINIIYDRILKTTA